MLIIKLLSGLALIGSVVWFITKPDYEPAITSVTSLSALIAVLIGEKSVKQRAMQNQSVAESGIGIQAGGNVTVGDIHANREANNAE